MKKLPVKSSQLTIHESCHQNWNEMLPEEQGKFCLSCQKTVVDFSAMSDREVLNYFNTNTGNTCGRFNNNQLNTSLSVPKERSIGKWKYFKMGLKDGAVTMSGIVIPLKLSVMVLPNAVVRLQGSTTIISGSVSIGSGSVRKDKKSGFNFFKTKKDMPDESSGKILPNPITPGQNFKVEFTLPKIDNFLFEIFDASGKLIQSHSITMNSLHQTETIDGQGLQQAGVYIVHLTNGEKKNVFYGKLEVQ